MVSNRWAVTTASLLALGFLASCRASWPSEPPPVPGESVFYTFEKYPEGPLPTTWECEGAAVAKAADASARVDTGPWSIRKIERAPSGTRVVAHRGAGSEIASLRGARYSDVKIAAAVRPAGSGAANLGIAWRIQGPSDCLVLRICAEEGKLKIQSIGRETATLAECPFAADPGRWVNLSIEQEGDKIRCGAAGEILLEATDPNHRPPGSAGLFCGSGGEAEFDNFTVVGAVPR